MKKRHYFLMVMAVVAVGLTLTVISCDEEDPRAGPLFDIRGQAVLARTVIVGVLLDLVVVIVSHGRSSRPEG